MSSSIFIEKEQNYDFVKLLLDCPEIMNSISSIEITNYNKSCEGVRGYVSVDVKIEINFIRNFFPRYVELFNSWLVDKYK